MNWEKRLEDARARRQVVLEQKDRAAQAAKAAAQITPDPAKSPTHSGVVQSVPRARPAGTNARAVEAALRKRDIVQQADQLKIDTFDFRANENVAPEITEIRKDPVEGVPQAAEYSGVAHAGQVANRKSRPGLRILLVASAVLIGFGIGIFAGPSIISRIQRLAPSTQHPIATHIAPRLPAAIQIADGQRPSLANANSQEAPPRAGRSAPSTPELIVFKPALPLVSSPVVGSNEVAAVASTAQVSEPGEITTLSSPLIASTRPAPRRPDPEAAKILEAAPLSLAATDSPNSPLLMRRSVDEVSNIQIAALPRIHNGGVSAGSSTLSGISVDTAPIALLSPGPQLVTAPGSDDLLSLLNPDELPTLPLQSNAPNRPDSGPTALTPLVGDRGVSAGIAAPPATIQTSPRLSGIGDLRTYLVHLQSPRSLSDGQHAGFESTITDTGLPIGKVNRVGYKISASHVRYYHPRDAVAATALAERIDARARDFTSFRPSPPIGTLEVFLSRTANSRRAAAQGGAQSSQQDRELIELRDRLIQSLRRGDHL